MNRRLGAGSGLSLRRWGQPSEISMLQRPRPIDRLKSSWAAERPPGGADGTHRSATSGSKRLSDMTDIAFAFDIDGVLYQGSRAIPGAREVLKTIHSHGIRYVFLTNGGGVHEEAKAVSLAKRLHMPECQDLIGKRMIVSHSPMRAWDDVAKKRMVLITAASPETAREVANDYGFSSVVTPSDLIHADEKLYPFDPLKGSLHSRFRQLPEGKTAARSTDPYSRHLAEDALRVDTIMVWNDPRDWSLDIQVIHDLLVSHKGYLGTLSEKNGDRRLPNNGWQQDGQPELWISNLDLFWKTEYPLNRFGTGAFVEALRGVWSAVTGGAELKLRALGKPFEPTYEYAHDRLLHYHSGMEAAPRKRQQLRRVYMIGDNPESDVRGAKEFRPKDGSEWLSILVRTGVWRGTANELEPAHKADAIVDDVVEAVAWALRQEGVNLTRDRLLGGDTGVHEAATTTR